MKIEIGQEIIVVGIGNNARYGIPIHKGIVIKIGRKWFEIETDNYVGKDYKFYLENGKCDGGQYMSEWQVFLNHEDYEKAVKTPDLRNELAKRVYSLSYEQLKHILDYLDSL